MKLNKTRLYSYLASIFFAGCIQAQQPHRACDVVETDKALMVARVINSDNYSPGSQAFISELFAVLGTKVPIYPSAEIQTKESQTYNVLVTVSSKESMSDKDEGMQVLLPFISFGVGDNQYWSKIQVDYMVLDGLTGRVMSSFRTYSVMKENSSANQAEADHKRVGVFFEKGHGRADNTLFGLRQMHQFAATRILEVIKGLPEGSCRNSDPAIISKPQQISTQFDGVEKITITARREDLRSIYFPRELSSKVRCSSKGRCTLYFDANPSQLMANMVEDAYANSYDAPVKVTCEPHKRTLTCEIWGSSDNLQTFNRQHFLKLLYGRNT